MSEMKILNYKKLANAKNLNRESAAGRASTEANQFREGAEVNVFVESLSKELSAVCGGPPDQRPVGASQMGKTFFGSVVT
jgi:hypothetical protein